ncbi:MAG: hypothetical protein WCP06_09905 [Verrucomicrobiota bacterium]
MASPDEWFNGTLEAFRSGKLAAYVVFDLGLSPRLGIHRLPRAQMMMPQSVIRKAIAKHSIDLTLLQNLPSVISDPVRIFLSATEANSFVFQLKLVSNQEALVAAMEYCRHADFGMAYLVKSIHPRLRDHFSRWEERGLLLFERKENAK